MEEASRTVTKTVLIVSHHQKMSVSRRRSRVLDRFSVFGCRRGSANVAFGGFVDMGDEGRLARSDRMLNADLIDEGDFVDIRQGCGSAEDFLEGVLS